MLDKYQDYDKAKAARAGLPPRLHAGEENRKGKTRIEVEENEDLEEDEGLPEAGPSKAEEGLAETPAKTGGEAQPPRRKSANDASDPQAVIEEMRNQDA